MHLLRTCPASKAAEELRTVDEQFTSAFDDILKTSISGDALVQMSLPTSCGGLGIPVPSQIAPAAFAASCCAAEDDVRAIVGNDSEP